MNNLFQNIIIRYYNFIVSMNKILKFDKLIQYNNIKSMKLGVYMNNISKL